MERIRYIIIFTICLLIFAPVLPASTNASEEWERALYLSERDRTRLVTYMKESGWEESLSDTLSEYQAELDYSRAFIKYNYYHSGWNKYYESGTETVSFCPNYDGLPGDGGPGEGQRYIVIPAYRENILIGRITFWDTSPEAMSNEDIRPSCTPNPDVPCGTGGLDIIELQDEFEICSEIDEWQYIEKGYDILSVTGLNVEIILCNTDNRAFFKTDKGYYVYPAYNTAEPEKGNQAMPLDEFIRAVYMGQIPYEPVFVTPEPTPTPTPTPTPRPSRTMATPRSTVEAPTAAPSVNGTAAPEIADTASIISSASAMPEPRVNKTARIIIGIVLICVLGGGAAGTAVFVRRRKAGK